MVKTPLLLKRLLHVTFYVKYIESKWLFKCDPFQDYVVLLPQDYYEASILQKEVHQPCVVPATYELWVSSVTEVYIN